MRGAESSRAKLGTDSSYHSLDGVDRAAAQ
jgi:hypothetical protein